MIEKLPAGEFILREKSQTFMDDVGHPAVVCKILDRSLCIKVKVKDFRKYSITAYNIIMSSVITDGGCIRESDNLDLLDMKILFDVG